MTDDGKDGPEDARADAPRAGAAAPIVAAGPLERAPKLRLGPGDDGPPVEFGTETLRRHAVFLGSSGSGKTVACKVICEEAALAGIPVIAVDPQGDIASLKIPGDEAEIRARGGDDAARRRFAETVSVRLFTPGSDSGIALGANPLALPRAFRSEEDRVRSLSVVAGTVARLLGNETEGAAGRAVAAFLYTALDAAQRAGRVPATLADLAAAIAESREGGAAGEPLLSPRQRSQVEKGLRVLSVGAARLLYGRGAPIDVARLLSPDRDGRTRLSVVLLNSLGSQEEKDVFVSVLASAVHSFMLAHPSERLQALFYIDEIAPFLPPVRKPASKEALRLLFKQARKFGIGCLVATQNPGDIDYTALSQFGTWGLGRLATRQDIRKVSGVVKSLDPAGAEAILAELPALAPGRFVVLSPDEFPSPRRVRVRWLLTRHRTLEESAVRELTPDSERAEFAAPASAGGEAGAPALEAPADEPAPEPPLEERVLAFLTASRRAVRLREVLARGLAPRPAVTRALRTLVAEERVARRRCGSTTFVWDAAFRFHPELDLGQPVELADARVLEPRARAIARDASERRLVFFRQEEVESIECRHLPLNRFALEGGGELLLNALTGAFVSFDPDRGFSFLETIERHPEIAKRAPIGSLVPLRSVTPGEVGFRADDVKRIVPLEAALQRVRQSLGPVVPVAASRLFVPLWRAILKHRSTGAKRELLIDGLAGRPV